MEEKTSKKLIAANIIVLAIIAVQCLVWPLTIFASINGFKKIFSAMSIDLPIVTQLIISLPAWVYLACGLGLLVIMLVKEFLLKIDARILINVITVIAIQLTVVLIAVFMILPVLAIQTQISEMKQSASPAQGVSLIQERIAKGIGQDLSPVESTAPDTKQSPVPDMGMPVGQLGHSLGTILIVEGEVAPMPGKDIYLIVNAVNGQRLSKPVSVELDNAPSLAIGTRYVFKGYEGCQTVGRPVEEANPEIQPQQPWHLKRYFTVIGMIAPPPMPEEK
ncbi:MAG: hypothetical protein WC980_03225 [Candidatus Brocadiia bacterium]